MDMLDKRSRKVLNYIKKKGQASFDELLTLDNNQGLVAQMLARLNCQEYIVCVENTCNGKRRTVYELQEKGYGELEDYRRQAVYAYAPMLISLLALAVSILSLICTFQ